MMRAFFLESEVLRGTRNLVFYHGTKHSMSHACDTELLRDLVVRRKSLWARSLVKLASCIVSPRFYSELRYNGSTVFFAGTLANGGAVWRSGPTDRPQPAADSHLEPPTAPGVPLSSRP